MNAGSGKLVIFDFDGTIADSMWCWDRLGKITLEDEGLPLVPDYEAVIRTMSVPHFSEYLTKLYPQLGSAEQLMAKWHEEMLYYYRNHVELKGGIIPLLEHLKAEGYTIYLASATHYDVLIQAVHRFGLERYFDFIITEERVGISKRDPKIYQMCIERAGCTLKDVYLFEDANHALKTAKSIGINVCGVEDYSMRNHKEEVKSFSDIYVKDFNDLALIRRFLNE